MRADEHGFAQGPVPATPFAATARMDDGSWRFVSEDGSLYRAPSATGALSLVDALPFRVEPVAAADGVVRRGVHSRGALALLDDTLHAWMIDATGTRTRLPFDRVISVTAASSGFVVVLTEPGVLRTSSDGGAHFGMVRPPAGVPIATWLDVDGVRVRTTAGTFRFVHGSLAAAPEDVGAAARVRADATLVDRLARGFDATRGALDTLRVPYGSLLAGASGAAIDLVDARTGAARGRLPSPGDACELHAGFHGLRAVCHHAGWARFVTSREVDGDAWTVLRDEQRAEPMGPVVFDDATRAWAVHAPCTQRTVIDPRAVCLYDARGATHALTMPLDADLVAMHGEVVWAVSAPAGDVTPSLVALRAEGVSTIALPDEARGTITVFAGGPSLSVTYAHGGVFTLARRRGAAWVKVDLPDGVSRSAFRSDGTLFAWGSDARAVGHVRPDARAFEADALTQGDPSLVALDADARAFCAGAWCRFGEGVTVTEGPRGAPPVITRARAAPTGGSAPAPMRELRCEEGAVTVAPEIDHGAAASGYAVRATRVGASLTVTWAGATVSGSVAGARAQRPGARVFPRGVQGATSPAALVELCDDAGCDDLVVTRAGVTELGLGRQRPGGVEVQLSPNGYVARADTLREGVSLVTLVALDRSGAITRRQTFALAEAREDAHVGSWLGADGLWVRDREGQLGFVAMDPSDFEGRVRVRVPLPGERTRGCAAGEVARGEVRMMERVAQVRGRAWFVEAGEWQQEQLLAVDEGRVCVRSITGGEARDEDEARAGGREEREPVRSFALRADGADGFVGRAWSGERAITLRCARE